MLYIKKQYQMDFCLRRNDGGAAYKWISTFAGMTDLHINGFLAFVGMTEGLHIMDSCLRKNDGTPSQE